MEKRYTLPVAIALVVGTVIGSGVFFIVLLCKFSQIFFSIYRNLIFGNIIKKLIILAA